ncbi:MAG TPA: hypothetical protein VK506_09845, partial [Conexibacter sp.]|nr:hypothetical protein [Conexibacter sp.]
MVAGDGPPTDVQAEALRLLDQLASRHAMDLAGLTGALTAIDAEAGSPIANELHLICGGAIPSVEDADPLVQELQTIGRDTFPALLAPIRQPFGRPFPHAAPFQDGFREWLTGIDRAILAHPGRARAAALVAEDPTIGPLLGPAGTAGAAGAWVELSTGGGQRLTSDMLCLGILECATWAAIDETEPVSAARFLALIRAEIETMRRLLAGDTVVLQQLVGWASHPIAPDVEVETPWGILRPATERQQAVRPFGIGADAILHLPVGVSATVNQPTDPGAGIDMAHHEHV